MEESFWEIIVPEPESSSSQITQPFQNVLTLVPMPLDLSISHLVEPSVPQDGHFDNWK